MQHPQDYPRRTLLVVTGLSPQVVTETLWALTVGAGARERFVPTEIHVLTTRQGAERIRLQLLSEDPGWFWRLLAEYDLPPIRFQLDQVHVAERDGRPLDDIRDEGDSQAVGDFIMEWVRRLTGDDQAAVHASIAGGRKTMGFYLGYAMSLFGRVQDRLSHVLVDAPFESLSDFFYPAPTERVVIDRNNNPLDAALARVWLAGIPFVRLREGLPRRLLDGKAGFAETVEAAQRALEPPRLTVDLSRACIVAGGETVHMAPADLAFYAMMARRRALGRHAVRPEDLELEQDYLPEHERIQHAPHDRVRDRIRDIAAEPDAMQMIEKQRNWFDERCSKTNAALLKALGEVLAKPYLIRSQGQRPRTRYGLTLEPEAIEIIDPD
ncbi:MAG TPA: TIGR02584 family CRISPR-associated protein [Chromatiales bacterium]|nr:TIGR02584 family CRISPR-associated protein [Chromatiales bacterium]